MDLEGQVGLVRPLRSAWTWHGAYGNLTCGGGGTTINGTGRGILQVLRQGQEPHVEGGVEIGRALISSLLPARWPCYRERASFYSSRLVGQPSNLSWWLPNVRAAASSYLATPPGTTQGHSSESALGKFHLGLGQVPVRSHGHKGSSTSHAASPADVNSAPAAARSSASTSFVQLPPRLRANRSSQALRALARGNLLPLQEAAVPIGRREVAAGGSLSTQLSQRVLGIHCAVELPATCPSEDEAFGYFGPASSCSSGVPRHIPLEE